MPEEEIIRKELLSKYKSTIRAKDRVGEWSTFEGFYKWAIEAGYQQGRTMNRRDTREGHNPENCFFIMPPYVAPFQGDEYTDWIRRWNRAVNPLRVAAGLKPFPDPVADVEKQRIM